MCMEIFLWKLQTPKINMGNDKITSRLEYAHTYSIIFNRQTKNATDRINQIGQHNMSVWVCVTKNQQSTKWPDKQIERDRDGHRHRKEDRKRWAWVWVQQGMNECISCLILWIYILYYAYETFIVLDVSLVKPENLKTSNVSYLRTGEITHQNST